ncbi:hypothetical protein BCR32DRAFT_286941 [Anaeromyces robustus]|uniref:Uncharacterized protein n=1 Tax=Anaeromyces robustus TaxID=1754192 RepID=A0A1Y1VTR1_9FUNG|nr:hypothetical protein BCR32DRAFT_286941 [Anaeromyces robustus]|eukprot:ORX64677.1 hypothetical protein BCR32DRAFT_286941 [Anaeromyces robustus]
MKRQQKFNQNNKGISMNSEANSSQQYNKNKKLIKCQICNKFGYYAKVCRYRNNDYRNNKNNSKNNEYKHKNNSKGNNNGQSSFCCAKADDPEKYVKFAIDYNSDKETTNQANCTRHEVKYYTQNEKESKTKKYLISWTLDSVISPLKE